LARTAAISVDPPATSVELAKKLGVTFPLLSDESRATIRAFGVEDVENGISWPAIFVVDKQGRIVWRSLAQTYKIRAMPGQILDALPK
jgi:peroxiredoxin